jgi:hypothetical protein
MVHWPKSGYIWFDNYKRSSYRICVLPRDHTPFSRESFCKSIKTHSFTPDSIIEINRLNNKPINLAQCKYQVYIDCTHVCRLEHFHLKVHIHRCMHVELKVSHVRMHLNTFMPHTHVSMHIHASTHVYAYIHASTHVYEHAHASMDIHTCICMCIYTCIRIHSCIYS